MKTNTRNYNFKSFIFLTSLVVMVIFGMGILQAQNLKETVEQLPEDPAKEFVRPLTDAFGANLNTGWLSNAPVGKVLGLDFKVGLVLMGAVIDEDKEVFILLDQFFPFTESQASLIGVQTSM